MTREEMFHKLILRHEELVCKYTDKHVTDKQFFEELCCSIYAGDEFKKSESKTPVLDDNFMFEYKGYEFELTPCTLLNHKQDVLDTADEFRRGGTKGIFTDRYVCWMFGHKDIEGKTKEQSDDPDNWVAEIHLVPEAWAYGAEFDCNPGVQVEQLILDKISQFLEQNPDL